MEAKPFPQQDLAELFLEERVPSTGAASSSAAPVPKARSRGVRGSSAVSGKQVLKRPATKEARPLRVAALAAAKLPVRGKGKRKQVKRCSKCGAFGHRADSRKCPDFGAERTEANPLPRWTARKQERQAAAAASVSGARPRDLAQPRARVTWVAASVLRRILDKLRLRREPPPAWEVKYMRDVSPGRQQRVRVDRRCEEKPQKVLEADEGAAYSRLLRAGFARQWAGKFCSVCESPFRALSPGGVFKCRRASRHTRHPWAGTAFAGSTLSDRHKYNLCIGYAARLSPTQAVVDKGVNRETATCLWRFFRRAEAHSLPKIMISLKFEVWVCLILMLEHTPSIDFCSLQGFFLCFQGLVILILGQGPHGL